jgi:hypothetical protein
MVRRVTSGRWGTAVLAAALGLAGAGVAPAVATVDPVEVVVTAGTLDAAARAVDASGGVVTTPLEFLGGVAATLPSTAVAALQARPGITVTPDEVVEVAATDTATDLGARLGPTDVAGQDQLAALSLPDHWSPASGAGVGVALLDTGVADLPELEGRVVRGPDLSGDGDGIDHHGHGTFMAGLIAADGRVRDEAEPRFGVAPGAHIVSVKLAGRDGRTTMSRVLEGIGWAITNQDEHGIRVLSLSLGVATNRAPQADPLAMAVDAAWASGLTVVTASGNEPGKVTSPGRSNWVVTVGATDTKGTPATGDDTLATWSGAGKVTGTRASRRARSRCQHRVAPRPRIADRRGPPGGPGRRPPLPRQRHLDVDRVGGGCRCRAHRAASVRDPGRRQGCAEDHRDRGARLARWGRRPRRSRRGRGERGLAPAPPDRGTCAARGRQGDAVERGGRAVPVGGLAARSLAGRRVAASAVARR